MDAPELGDSDVGGGGDYGGEYLTDEGPFSSEEEEDNEDDSAGEEDSEEEEDSDEEEEEYSDEGEEEQVESAKGHGEIEEIHVECLGVFPPCVAGGRLPPVSKFGPPIPRAEPLRRRRRRGAAAA